jgi:hypothetical protein
MDFLSCLCFSLFPERSNLLSASFCFSDDADEQDVVGPVGHGVGSNAAADRGK